MRTSSCFASACAAAAAGVALAGSSPSGVPVPYELTSASEFQKGCFPPCRCPVLIATAVTGGFLLDHIETNPLFTIYAVKMVDLDVQYGGETTPVTGSGTYTVGGEVAYMQRMELDLAVGNDPVEHFDSGWTSVNVPWPALDVTVSINDMVCFDTVIHIVAGPAPSGFDLDGDG